MIAVPSSGHAEYLLAVMVARASTSTLQGHTTPNAYTVLPSLHFLMFTQTLLEKS
jgi:hypothetical protein